VKPGRDQTNAVSPVVGVMLMLAVTVMIAAIVSTYAGGFSGGAEKSPQSSIQVTPDLNQNQIYFDHNGGDPFTLSSIDVVLQAYDNKTTLSTNDVGSKINVFEEVGGSGGSNDTTIRAGDTFVIQGYPSGDPNNDTRFGSLILTENTKITWLIVDKGTGNTISTGSFYL
jgi:FlaG/FlaF family flagellin (archaellin)